MNCISDSSEIMKSYSEDQPLVSILINNYNYAPYLKQAIDSALNQTYVNTEVIVVDDGSTDNSRDIINEYGNQIIPVFKINGGQASAMNAGFAASKGEIICLLDSDDIYLPEKVSEIVNLFKSQANIDWVFHESAPIKSEEISNTEFKELVHKVYCLNSESPKKIDFRTNILNAELPNFTPSTSNLCFSRAVLEKIFPLPEVRGFSGMAITDLYIKYLAVGLSIGYRTVKNLGIFRLHNNTYSSSEVSQDKKRGLYAEIQINTAYWMLVNFPEFSKLSQKLFSKALATYLRSNNNEVNYNDLIKKYLSIVPFIEKFEVSLKTFYYFIKLGFVPLL
ncbi:putative glycosyl transferase [Calothrix sp. NIES-4071]|nr:putative glycosyl transferase [Calothrix sp. NIES-4071]BAZ57235.1 putative glycosyl transferase [Calothrix sp. NIES-4105]